ncbi:MAG TPA: hypothetical protein VEW69_08015 [Alphaproteobacteria bacterium]|nr:hypothetical protein [Alphaproteobacteria bacterium]
MEQAYETIHTQLDKQEQRGRRLLAFAPIQGSLAALVLVLSILNLIKSVLNTLHQPLPAIGFVFAAFIAALCSGRLGYGVYREAVTTAVQIICGAQASALIRLNAKL